MFRERNARMVPFAETSGNARQIRPAPQETIAKKSLSALSPRQRLELAKSLRKEGRYKDALAVIDDSWEYRSSVKHELIVLRLICQCNLGHWQDGLKTVRHLDPEVWPKDRREKLLIYEQRNTWEKAQFAIYSRFNVRDAIALIEKSEKQLANGVVSPWATQKRQLADILKDAKFGVKEKALSGYALQLFRKRRQEYGKRLLEYTTEGDTEPSQKSLQKFAKDHGCCVFCTELHHAHVICAAGILKQACLGSAIFNMPCDIVEMGSDGTFYIRRLPERDAPDDDFDARYDFIISQDTNRSIPQSIYDQHSDEQKTLGVIYHRRKRCLCCLVNSNSWGGKCSAQKQASDRNTDLYDIQPCELCLEKSNSKHWDGHACVVVIIHDMIYKRVALLNRGRPFGRISNAEDPRRVYTLEARQH